MLQSVKIKSLSLVIIFISSCTQVNKQAGFKDVESVILSRLDKKIQWNQGTEDDKKVSEEISKLLQKKLTLDASVQIALLNNPEIQVTYESLGIAQAELVQAGLLKNPIFEAEVHFEGGGIGRGTNLGILNNFIDIFQLPLRKKIAEGSFESTKLEVIDSILNLSGEVKTAYFSLQGSEELLNLRKSIVEGLKTTVDIVKRQHEAGNTTDLDLAIEQGVYAKAKLDLAQSEAEVILEREKLNLLMGLWGNDLKWQIHNRLPNPPKKEISVDKFESMALANRLDLKKANNDIETLGLSLGLTESYRLIPEFTLGIDVEGEDSGNSLVGPNLQLPIPIFDQGQAQVARAESFLKQAQKRSLAIALKIRSEVRSATALMLTSRARVLYARNTLLPISEKVVNQTQLEYNAMLAGVFQLINAKNEEIEAGTTYVESLKDYWLARTRLETVIGGSFTLPVLKDTTDVVKNDKKEN